MNVELPTPCIVVSLETAERNLCALQDRCTAAGKDLRIHFKSIKCRAIAQRLIDRGVLRFAVAKVGEAEVLRSLGAFDLHIAYPAVGPHRARRIAELARGEGSLSVSVDSMEHLDELLDVMQFAPGRMLGISVSVDLGYDRCGVRSVEQARLLIERILEAPQLYLAGFDAYCGTLAATSHEGYYQIADELLTQLVHCAGLEPRPRVSVGGTPSIAELLQLRSVTELIVGSYLFQDLRIAGQYGDGRSAVGAKVLATVVSRPTPGRAIIDAGSKALSRHAVEYRGSNVYGMIEEYPDVKLVQLNEEHGWLDVPEGCTGLHVGERVSIVPINQSLVFSNFDTLFLSENGEYSEYPLEARGMFV